jgi:general secretion pathway protein N
MKRLRLKLALLATGIFLVGLIVKFPASIAAVLVTRMNPGVAIAAAEGSIWEGHFAKVTVAGRTLDSVNWDLHALDLLLLRIAADTEMSLADDRLQATIRTRSGGNVDIRNLRGTLDLKQLEALRLMPERVAQGELLLDITSLVLHDNVPVEADGRIQLSGLRSPLLSGAQLGDFTGSLSTADSGIELVFRDTPGQADAPLELQGNAILSGDGSYHTQGSIRPTPNTPENLRNGMQFLGQADASGRYRFSFNGRL